MNTEFSLKLQIAGAGLALAMISGGCATVTPRAEHYVRVPVGSTFTFDYRNSGSYGSRSGQMTSKNTERMWEGKLTWATEGPLGVTLLNADGAWPAQLTRDGKLARSFDPPIGFNFPLVVGKTWTKTYKVTEHATNKTTAFDSTWKVEAYEDVTVPAGTFKAFKIAYADTIGQENIYWYNPDLGNWAKASFTHTAKHPAGPGQSELQLAAYTIAK